MSTTFNSKASSSTPIVLDYDFEILEEEYNSRVHELINKFSKLPGRYRVDYTEYIYNPEQMKAIVNGLKPYMDNIVIGIPLDYLDADPPVYAIDYAYIQSKNGRLPVDQRGADFRILLKEDIAHKIAVGWK